MSNAVLLALQLLVDIYAESIEHQEKKHKQLFNHVIFVNLQFCYELLSLL